MFKRITLEMSLKPFKQTNDEYIANVIKNMFIQWRPLLKDRNEISIMLWTADGSEILDYDANDNTSFEWCCFIGTANKPLHSETDDPALSLHAKKHKYIDDPQVMTYGILKKIVSEIKKIGKELYPCSEITVGETFDIGPEFAISDFKYKRHTEVSSGQKLDQFGFVDATALLKKDNFCYATYPNGIPENTPFATFFGKQANAFLKDMGFDYLWLSNGVGFGDSPWSLNGKVFDGKQFYPDKLPKIRKNVLDFWKLFRAECPEFLIATRGTNNSVGIDYATDGVALYDIYNGDFNILPPPNSPWAALDDNFGLELMGQMTRICELPGKDFLFRFYIHDPWWANSPWYDRYGGEPHDIYLPMAISRIDESGNANSAELFNILSIDNSFGDMPDACVNEPLPHILKAEKETPDRPAPLVWVYPIREYTTAKEVDVLAEMYYGDKFIMNAINDGLPLNCVVSTDNFLKNDLEIYKASVLISPVPQSADVASKLMFFEQKGGKVVYYGSTQGLAGLVSAKHKVDYNNSPSGIREVLADFDYDIQHKKLAEKIKSPCMTISYHDNAMFFSVYNPNITTETELKLPLGAPLLTNMDCEIKNGYASYRFARSEHRECRVFVEQKDGIVSVKEAAPVSTVYHRVLTMNGLDDANICIFPENRGECSLKISLTKIGDQTPVYDDRFKRIEDPEYGVYYKGEHISGNCLILLPR